MTCEKNDLVFPEGYSNQYIQTMLTHRHEEIRDLVNGISLGIYADRNIGRPYSYGVYIDDQWIHLTISKPHVPITIIIHEYNTIIHYSTYLGIYEVMRDDEKRVTYSFTNNTITDSSDIPFAERSIEQMYKIYTAMQQTIKIIT